ncbi:MAG: hypothetical protein ACI8ZB_001864 [Desulforhopalus sp.]|jgi:uncharacterized protein (TIGR02285 family)
MKKWIFIFFIIEIVFVGAAPLFAESITWYQPDFPPYVILDGSDKKHGIDNNIVQTVVDRLPEYEHVYEVANYRRILRNLSSGRNGIITPLFKIPAREKYVHYTKKPSYLVYSNGFLYPDGEKDKFAAFILKDGSIDLDALCVSGQVKIGINAGRSYYGIIDEIIGKYGDECFVARSAIDHLGMFKMVQANRVDAAIGFPVEVKYAGMQGMLEYLSVSQMDVLTAVYFGAAKNTFGREIVDRLNAILDERAITDQFSQYYMYWLDDALKADYEKVSREYERN